MTLKVSNFTKNYPGLHSRNFGGMLQLVCRTRINVLVIELMILRACDVAIDAKQKWLSTQMLLSSTSKRLNIKNLKERQVVTETKEGDARVSLYVTTDLEKDFLEVEKSLYKKTSILSQLLWKYNLMTKLHDIDVSYLREGEALQWESISFTKLRSSLLKYFSLQNSTIQAGKTKTKSVTREVGGAAKIVGSLAMLKKSSSLSHLDRRPEQRIGIHDSARKALKSSQSNLSRKVTQAELPHSVLMDNFDLASPLYHQDYFEYDSQKNTQDIIPNSVSDSIFTKTIVSLSPDVKDLLFVTNSAEDQEFQPRSRRSSVKGDQKALL